MAGALLACTTTREERVVAALQGKGFEEVELTRKNSSTYAFTGTKDGVACKGTATVSENNRGYTAKEGVKADWRCGQ